MLQKQFLDFLVLIGVLIAFSRREEEGNGMKN
jgi:hypothetical protein